MIDYGYFQYASPPCTAGAWFVQAACLAGLPGASHSDAHKPFIGTGSLRVTTVRHPCRWLERYYIEIHRTYIHVPVVDRFRVLPHTSFDAFIRAYLARMSGAVWDMFRDYQADSYIKMEDLPWAAVELFEACGLPKDACQQCITLAPPNDSRPVRAGWQPSLYDRVCDAETEMMSYFWYPDEKEVPVC